MALKGFLALVDDKLSEAFHYVAPDKTKHRKPFLSGLDKAKASFEEGKQPRGKTAQWSANNNTVRFEPKLAGTPVSIHGKTEHYIPAERFPNALAELRKEVEAGDHDDTLHAAFEGVSKGAGRERRDSNMGSVRAGWSPERRAKYEASMAAKRAGKPS